MVYPLPDGQIGFVEFIQYVNADISAGFLGVLLLGAVFAVAFISTIKFDFYRAIIGSLFITTLASVMMAFLQLVSPSVMAILTALLGVSIFLAYRSE